MTDKLDMLVEKDLKGCQSRSKSSFRPRPTSLDPSMNATPSDASSSAQPSTLLVPLTSTIPLEPTSCTLEMSKYTILHGTVAMPFSSITSTCSQLVGEHIFVSFSVPNILQRNENKSKEYDEIIHTFACACAATKTLMESKENNTYLCIDTKLSTVVGHWNKPRMTCHQEGENDEIIHTFLAPVVTFKCPHGLHLS
jgi:hypothetical protein